MRTAEMKRRMGLPLSEAPLKMTQQRMEQFLNTLKAEGRKTQTLRTYRRSMQDLYDFLPEEKEITKEALENWRKYLKGNGYSDSTVNLRMTAVNGLLRHCGREEFLASHERIELDADAPEMTRAEYLQFLSAAREMRTEKEYFLIKVFASVDVGIGELQYLTVEACREGIVFYPDGRRGVIPSCLKEELLQYADRHDIADGPVFVTRTGNLLDRSNIANALRILAERSGIDAKKCCPSALHRIYRTTQKELMEHLQPIYIQSYENLLNMEQVIVAW